MNDSMIEKRYTIKYGRYIDNVDNIEYDEKWENWKICGLLNELNDENKELRKIITEQKEQIDLLEKNREILNKWIDEYVDKFTEVWRIVEPCRRG